jgi:hypothetical protein
MGAKMFSQELLREEYQAAVRPFVEAVRNNDKEKIISLIRYPLQRQYPIPYIYNEQEMRARYDQVFDEELLDAIKNSSIETDWIALGWRGIRLGQGLAWVDYDGRFLSTDYQSAQESRMRNDIILAMKNNLHESLKEFKTPWLACETESYKIRIDLLHDHSYRLALWTKEKEEIEVSDIVLMNGEGTVEGSAGNQIYTFHYNNREYILGIDSLNYTGFFRIHNGISIRLQELLDKKSILTDEDVIKVEF